MVVSNLIVGIVQALKLKQTVLVALFTTQRLEEATASEKAGAIRTAPAQLKELKAMRNKGGLTKLANWVTPSPCHGSVWGEPPGPVHPLTTPAAVSEVGFSPSAPAASAAYLWEGFTVAGESMPAAGRGTTAPRTGGPTRDTEGRAVTKATGAAAAEAPRLPEVYSRRFDFHKIPSYDLAIERMHQVRQVGPCPPLLPQLRTHTRKGQLSVSVISAVRPSVAIYVRRPDPRYLHRSRAQAR